MSEGWRRALVEHPWVPVWLTRGVLLPYRAVKALSVCARPMQQVLPWLLRSREYSSWTYHLSELNLTELCSAVALMTGRPLAEVRAWLGEVLQDSDLRQHVERCTRASRWARVSDAEFKPNRRLLMYLLTRAQGPRLVVEAGVDKGLAAVLVCRALARNRSEGRPGRYLGIDIHPIERAYLFESPWAGEGELVQGDAVAVLNALDEPVDLYSHETVPEAAHTRAALDALWPRWTSGGLFYSTWTTREMVERFSDGARFLTVMESPVGHWYPGSRLMLARRDAAAVAAPVGSATRCST